MLTESLRDGDAEEMQELQRFVPAMYECTLVRLRATDMDQEVKERAIAACGQLICHFGDYLEVSQYPRCYVAHHQNILSASLEFLTKLTLFSLFA